MNEEPKQLKLTPRPDGEVKGKKDLPAGRHGKKEKEEKANKWIVVLILFLTVVVSLIFYVSGGWNKQPTEPNLPPAENNSLFGPKIYKF